MSITLFGTCRINGIRDNNNLNNLINYTHSTKEVLQQIRFLLGEQLFPSPFDQLCFRTGIVENRPIVHNSEVFQIFKESTTCVVEICSDKKYMYDDFLLHHLCVDKRCQEHTVNTPAAILDGFRCVKQTPDEIENDIVEIKRLLEPRAIILVTHYNSKLNGEYIESRSSLITLLQKIAKKYNIPVINPSTVLKQYTQTQVMTPDLGHYTRFGFSVFTQYMNNYFKSHRAKKRGTNTFSRMRQFSLFR